MSADLGGSGNILKTCFSYKIDFLLHNPDADYSQLILCTLHIVLMWQKYIDSIIYHSSFHHLSFSGTQKKQKDENKDL